MSNPHEPRDAFVAQLEDRLRADLGRRHLAAPAPRWLPRTTRGLVFATAALVVVSMAVGGGAVSAAYQAQQGAQRDTLVTTLEQRLDLSRKRLDLVRQRHDEMQRRVATGVEDPAAVADARLNVTEAEVNVSLIELDIAEVRATGREPMPSVSAPLVNGRDFVIERWQLEAQVPAAAREVGKMAVDLWKRRYAVGVANNNDVEKASARLIEVESVEQLIQQKIAIRQAFLKRTLTAAVADLRVMEVEAEQRRTILSRRIEFSRRQLQDLEVRTQIGIVLPVEVAEAKLRLQELELARSKADYDLALIRKQLGK